MKPNVHFHIDRLVLDSTFAHLDRDALGAAAQAELARLLNERGIPSAIEQKARVPRLDIGAFDMEPGAGAAAIGQQVAQRIYGGLDR